MNFKSSYYPSLNSTMQETYVRYGFICRMFSICLSDVLSSIYTAADTPPAQISAKNIFPTHENIKTSPPSTPYSFDLQVRYDICIFLHLEILKINALLPLPGSMI